jgi:hypothetical protein
MALQMKDKCEACGKALQYGDEAYVCSYECTFCRTCSEERKYTCPNCAGELLRRPKRRAAAS